MLISPSKRGTLVEKFHFTKRVTLSSSDKIEGTAIKLLLNDHCPLNEGEDTTADKVVDLLEERWERSMSESQEVFKGLLDAVAEAK
jgi:hypothetical protein